MNVSLPQLSQNIRPAYVHANFRNVRLTGFDEQPEESRPSVAVREIRRLVDNPTAHNRAYVRVGQASIMRLWAFDFCLAGVF